MESGRAVVVVVVVVVVIATAVVVIATAAVTVVVRRGSSVEDFLQLYPMPTRLDRGEFGAMMFDGRENRGIVIERN